MTAGILRARKALGIAIVAIFAVLFSGMTNGVSAQTPEGTTITNTATVNFTDANGNAYTQQQSAVTVTVGFLGNLSTTSVATQSPLSPSSENTLDFTITNNGNGSDTIQVGVTASNTSVTNILGYILNGNLVDTLTIGALNTLLADLEITSGGSATITVVYDVGSSQGDNTSNVELTATSQRTGGNADSSTTAVTPPTTGSVIVTSDVATVDRLPTGTITPVTYSTTFQVANASTSAQLIDLSTTVSPDGAGVTVISVNGNAGTGETGVSFTAGETKVITVVYSVTNGTGSSTLTLQGAGQTIGLDTDTHIVTGISPAISITKTVYATKTNAQDAISPLAPTARPQPGDTIWYRIQISNTGTAPAVISGTNDAAATMQVSDDLSGLPVTYEGTAPDATGSLTGWTTLQQTGPVTGALITGTISSLAVGANAFFVFGVIIN